MNRSYLFVPGDSERKLAKAASAGADALILDLEDAVAPAAKDRARQMVAEFLAGADVAGVWVRINPLGSAWVDHDLDALADAGVAGIVLPKPDGAADVVELARRLDRLERERGVQPGTTRILPIATERPGALFAMQAYCRSTPRLAALTWGAEDLAAAVGASRKRDRSGNWLPPFQLARSLCLFAAAAAGVPAIDTVYTDFRDIDGLAGYAAGAREIGFGGMLALHPAQVPVINAAFSPSDEEIGWARQVVGRFEASPGTGVVDADGSMLDRPHLLQANRILEMAARAETGAAGKKGKGK